jgi:hypothetical protein
LDPKKVRNDQEGNERQVEEEELSAVEKEVG